MSPISCCSPSRSACCGPRPGPSFAALSPAERRDLKEDVAAHVESWALAALERTPATLLVANFPVPAQPAFGVADLNAEYGETEFFLDLNLDLLRRFKGHPRVQIFDLDRLASRFGKDRVLDRRMYYLAKMEWSPAFLGCVAAELVRHARAARAQGRKCLVLDLDNTLWGGVVGEDGPAGVKIGPGDPEGEAFLDFHHRLKALQAQGVLLAVCSKNNPGDVAELFDSRPEIPLRLADFAAVEISWEPKHEGLKKIAAALDLGTDSLVFVDDNPAEMSLIQQMLPEVKTVLLPPDPAEYAAVIDRLTDFERTAVLEGTEEDRASTRENREREALRTASGGSAPTSRACAPSSRSPAPGATTCRASTSCSPRPTSSTSPPSATRRPRSSASSPRRSASSGWPGGATASATWGRSASSSSGATAASSTSTAS